MKYRFSGLDVTAMSTELAPKLVGMRLSNIYDINQKTFLFKFARSETKELLLIESGIRFHTTQFHRDRSQMPSGFCMKLRKHLRTKRLHSFQQLGMDRALDMRFGEGENAYHVIIELYAAGNIILTDHEYRILSLLRVVDLTSTETGAKLQETQESGSARMAVGEIYPISIAKGFEGMTSEKMKEALAIQTNPDQSEESTQDSANLDPPHTATTEKRGKKSQSKNKDKSKKKAADTTLKKVLRDRLAPTYGTSVAEHCLLMSGVDPNTQVTSELLDTDNGNEMLKSLISAFLQGDQIIRDATSQLCKGYIITKQFYPGKDAPGKDIPSTESTEQSESFETYDEFHPFLFAQFNSAVNTALSKNLAVKDFPTFDTAVDEFFSKLESQKLEMKARQAEQAAAKKLDSVKMGHATQIRNFELAQQNNELFAQAIEMNLYAVESVINTIRGFIAGGLDWNELWDLILDEQRRRNPLALLITGLKLESGMVTIALNNPNFVDEEEDDSDEEDDDEDTEKKTLSRSNSNLIDSDQETVPSNVRNHANTSSGNVRNKKTNKKNLRKDLLEDVVEERVLKLDIDIFSSAYANARRYYDARKLAAVKQEKTVEASQDAVKIAEKKIQQDLETAQKATAAPITKIRKPYWFEKFIWFISTENFLVVGGRDASQNELLVRRYMRKGDVYIHADMHGAASVIVKNLNVGDSGPPVDAENPVPPTTLLQAGTMSVCQSRAWEAKIVTSAYWVHSHQVSKSAPTGEYLTTGSFMIRGKKNWLPPIQLVYGFGLLFKIDESGIGRHFYERRPWARDGSGPRALEDGSSNVNESFNKSTSSLDNEGDDDDQDNNDQPSSDSDEDDQQDEESKFNNDDAQNVTTVTDNKVQDYQNENDDSEDDEEEFEFPDTEIQLPNVHQSISVPSEPAPADPVSPQEAEEDVEPDSKGVSSSESTDKIPARKHMSARERRLLKKKVPNTTADSESISVSEKQQGDSPPKKDSRLDTSKTAPSNIENSKQVRGKKGKLKKMKEKYADQDDEDREKMLELLASHKGPQPKGKKAKAAQAKKELEQERRKQQQQQQEHREKQKAANSEKKDRNQSKEDAEIKKLLEEENIALPDEDQVANMTYVDALTASPHEDDILLHAIPVCAPWIALQKYTYKVKLLPGSLKRGKAAKSVLAAFMNQVSSSRNDPLADHKKELVRAISENEVIAQIMAKVKVVSQESKSSGKKR